MIEEYSMFITLGNIIINKDEILMIQDHGYDDLLQKNFCKIFLRNGSQQLIELSFEQASQKLEG